MNKMLSIAVIIGMVIFVYVLMLVFMPVVADFASSGNTSMAATSNMSNYPGTGELMVASPWILWFVPAVGGMIGVVVVLRSS